MNKWKLKLLVSILTLAFAVPGFGATDFDDDYYDGYDYSYDSNYEDDWFHDSYSYGDKFNKSDHEYNYYWADNEYKWEESDLFFDDSDDSTDEK